MTDALFEESMTLAEARDLLRKFARDGHRCPCCSQLAKVYRRKINSGMARALVRMYRAAGLDWLHKPTVLKGFGAAARDESLLRYWSLIVEEIEERPDGGRSGWWRVTVAGEAFLRREVAVLKYALVYDGRLLKLEGPEVRIQECLGSKFDLGELLAS